MTNHSVHPTSLSHLLQLSRSQQPAVWTTIPMPAILMRPQVPMARPEPAQCRRANFANLYRAFLVACRLEWPVLIHLDRSLGQSRGCLSPFPSDLTKSSANAAKSTANPSTITITNKFNHQAELPAAKSVKPAGFELVSVTNLPVVLSHLPWL